MRLRALETEDLPFLYQWENDADAWCDSTTRNPLSHRILRDYIVSTTGDIYKDGQLRLILEDDGATVGCMDLFDFDPLHERAALGMYIAPETRGKGLGHEAVRLIEDYAFRFLHLHSLYAIIGEDNVACVRIYREAGFAENGRLKDWIRRGDKRVDALLFQKSNG